MAVRTLLSSLEYKGEASGKRQTYYVFEGPDTYLVLSLSRTKPNAGYFNVVSADAVRYARKSFSGERAITAKALHKRCRRPQLIRDRLEALNVLYVLVATRQAQIDARYATPELHFNLKSSG
jgi:hypothetical protein